MKPRLKHAGKKDIAGAGSGDFVGGRRGGGGEGAGIVANLDGAGTVGHDPAPGGGVGGEVGEIGREGAKFVGVDLDQKGMQMPQKFGSASSSGKKYALGNLFLIDDTQDPDHRTSQPETKKTLLTPKDDAFKKAQEFITGGGALSTIKKKYELSPEAETILSKL